MANKQGLQNYTVQEAQNINLGQCRSAYLSDDDTYTVASGEVVVAITIVQDCKFNTLTPQDPVNCFGDSAIGIGNTGGTGDAIAATALFPSGITLFGRWTEVDLVSGIVVLYMAR